MSENVFVSQPLPVGTILDNKFEIVRSLGQGGFGITYLGHNTVLDIPVAIKEYFPKDHASRKGTQVTIEDSAYFDEWKKKFRAEARSLAKFANLPGIVNVYDFCEENGTAYIIMEYLDGITLSKYVEKNGPMEAGSFLKRFIPVLTSLEKIHQQGLIHRDISPDNLMLMDDGFLKLYDFGAAREYSDATKPNLSVIIKRNFAPEEQYRSKGVQGPWTDVYSICATIYFSITGVVPDDSPQRVFSDELKKPSELGIYLPSKIEKTILKGMSVKSGDRFNSVRPLISAFEEADSANIKSGFGKRKKTKSTKAQNIFSLFHTSSKRTSVTSAHPSTSSSANMKTEIVLTQYGSGDNNSQNSTDNEVKRRHMPNPSNTRVSSQISSDNIIQNEPDVSHGSSRQTAPSVQQLPANYSKQKSSVDMATPDSSTAKKSKTYNALSDKQGAKDNKTNIACPKCNAVLPRTAKFCGICRLSLLHLNPSSNNGQALSRNLSSPPELQGTQKDPLYSTSIIAASNKADNSTLFAEHETGDNKTKTVCPNCNAVLPSDAKFCGFCGTTLFPFKATPHNTPAKFGNIR